MECERSVDRELVPLTSVPPCPLTSGRCRGHLPSWGSWGLFHRVGHRTPPSLSHSPPDSQPPPLPEATVQGPGTPWPGDSTSDGVSGKTTWAEFSMKIQLCPIGPEAFGDTSAMILNDMACSLTGSCLTGPSVHFCLPPWVPTRSLLTGTADKHAGTSQMLPAVYPWSPVTAEPHLSSFSSARHP